MECLPQALALGTTGPLLPFMSHSTRVALCWRSLTQKSDRQLLSKIGKFGKPTSHMHFSNLVPHVFGRLYFLQDMCTNTWGQHKKALFDAWLRYQITKTSSEVSPEQFPLTQPSWEEAQCPTREAGGWGAPPREWPVPWVGRHLAEPSRHRLCCVAAWHSLGLVDLVLMCRLWESTASLSCINRGP